MLEQVLVQPHEVESRNQRYTQEEVLALSQEAVLPFVVFGDTEETQVHSVMDAVETV